MKHAEKGMYGDDFPHPSWYLTFHAKQVWNRRRKRTATSAYI